jgi:replication-associated recombination protein RarA
LLWRTILAGHWKTARRLLLWGPPGTGKAGCPSRW